LREAALAFQNDAMSLTPSFMLPLGTEAPAFSLPDAVAVTHALDLSGRAPATLVVFLCNHCPYVIHLKAHFAAFARAYMAKGVQVVAVNSNDPGRYEEDGAAGMLSDAREFAYPFPYLVDASQEVAKAYKATCTPDFFLFGRDLKLAYRGQYDGSRPGNGKPVTGADLAAALDALLAGKPVPQKQFPSMGCNIKWKPGNEPAY
jgi:thiol-disulfide isomerase/thioredoxin